MTRPFEAIAFRGDDVIQRIDQQRSRVEPDGRAEVTPGLAGVLEGGNVTPQYAVVQGDVQLVDPQRIAVWRDACEPNGCGAGTWRAPDPLGVVGPEHEGEGIAPDRLRGAPATTASNGKTRGRNARRWIHLQRSTGLPRSRKPPNPACLTVTWRTPRIAPASLRLRVRPHPSMRSIAATCPSSAIPCQIPVGRVNPHLSSDADRFFLADRHVSGGNPHDEDTLDRLAGELGGRPSAAARQGEGRDPRSRRAGRRPSPHAMDGRRAARPFDGPKGKASGSMCSMGAGS